MPDSTALRDQDVGGVGVVKTAVLMHAIVADRCWPKISADTVSTTRAVHQALLLLGITNGGAAEVALALDINRSVGVFYVTYALHFHPHFPQEWLVVHVVSHKSLVRCQRQFSYILRYLKPLDCRPRRALETVWKG